ncbi:two-component sensor histidine kinase [Clostridium perfringens]|uniref:sensor histidine kinase n=1 Tax=Clostridium perfringens TaxID=1502 RepID=UPI000D71C06B|nr:HAMP domain-containing sensor histidine kinase [Clostridium perfringens]MBO3319869.1 HAMP domain-containing histidine kinase [Clostridium perfringens]MDU1112995.1 HAMP domain-containing sensor histidine kinase [Clostridium perfringens]MDU1957941.1 HAMP domain-containing sensor histidine kinase [Clostridium perfringens]PWX27147.1 two-component sensor histidine kinase [Clostridium perfringens]
MAIKSKSNKENLQVNKENRTNKTKWVFTIITLILIGIISVCLLLSYPIIKKNAPNYITSYSLLDNYNFREKIINTNYGIYYDYLEKKVEENDKELNPIEDLFTLKRENISNSEESPEYNLNEDKRELNSYIKELINKVHSLGNLRVYAMDEEGNTVYETKGDQNWLLEALAKGSYIENGDLENYYRFYMVLKYNNRGKVSLEKIYGEDSPRVSNLLLDMDSQYFAYHNEYEAKPIENMTYVYAVPKTLEYQDNLYYSEMNNKIMALGSASAPFIMIGIIVTCLLALLIPFKYTREVLGFNKFLKIPFEINFIIASIMLAFTIESGRLIIIPTLQGGLSEALKMTSLPHLDIVTNIINVLYWMVIYGFVFFEVIYVKYIFNIGFKNYIRKHLLVYKVKDVIFLILRKFINYIKGIDLNKNSDKVLLIILGINFVIVSILCSVWFFGIFGVVIYSGILFYFGRKYIDKWKKDYNKILEKTKEISNGNLDSKDDEDCGFFNPMRDELNNIQKGFKAAVEEEVKSQRMKTELISNVSHDLKTPLTSIIAYVDLLKGEEDEEKRKAYLETLERKSQRLKHLIEDLFEVSKATTGNINLNIMDVDISYLMKQVVLELDDKINEAGLDMRLSLPEEKVILPLDGQRTYRVFENLIINVVKYALPNSRVYIDIKEGRENVDVIIKNISADEITFNINEISDRFVRGDKSRNTEGSGLGLAIVKSFVELQGGKFHIEVDGDLFKAIISFKKK